jgi:hypothetical protein
MGRINWGRIILGGILAGIVVMVSEYVLNDVVLKQDWEAVIAASAQPRETEPSVIVWIVYSLLLGITAVWIYAGIRPRFGPGAGTALRAALAVWILGYLLWSIATLNLGFLPARLILISLGWGLAEAVIATQLGAWVYREA